MVFDWHINAGHVASMIILLVALGAYRQRFTDMQVDIKEIKSNLHLAIKESITISTNNTLLQHRMIIAEQDIMRARERIHEIANAVHIEFGKRDLRDGRQDMQSGRKD